MLDALHDGLSEIPELAKAAKMCSKNAAYTLLRQMEGDGQVECIGNGVYRAMPLPAPAKVNGVHHHA